MIGNKQACFRLVTVILALVLLEGLEVSAAHGALAESTKKAVIFVHGFTGSASRTWGNFPALIQTDPDLQGYEVLVWDYPSSLFPTGIFPISLFRSNPSVELLGRALLSELRGRFTDYDSVYLIGHSLGGIVIQSMIIEALREGRRSDIGHIKHIVLFGCPNKGAQIPALLRSYDQLAAIDITSDVVQSILNEWVNRVYLPHVKPGDENSKVRIPVTAIAGLEDSLVTPDSAMSFFQEPPAEVVPGTHTSMKEPESREALSYIIVQRIIKSIVLSESAMRSNMADLNITQLTSPGRVLSLDGYKVIPVGEKRIFTGGIQVSFTLSHNRKGQESIILKDMELIVHRFEKGPRQDLAYTVNVDKVRGAGTMAPHKFFLKLRNGSVEPAKWLVKQPVEKVVSAKSSNFFDYEGVQYLTFRANADDLEELEGRIMAKGPGLYEISFIFRYSVAGQDRVHETDHIMLYRKD